MRPPTREDCRLEPGLKGQPGGTFYWLKKERCFHQWALYGQGSRAAADRVCRCQPNPAMFGRTNRHICTSHLRTLSGLPVKVNARPPPAGGVMDELSGSGGLAAPSVQRYAAAAAAAATAVQHHVIMHARFWRYLDESRAWARGDWPVISAQIYYFLIVPKA